MTETDGLPTTRERRRVLSILSRANPPVAEEILSAIANGEPAEAMRQRATGTEPTANDRNTKAAAPGKGAPSAGAHSWSEITARFAKQPQPSTKHKSAP